MALTSEEKWILVAALAITGIFIIWFEVRYMMRKSKNVRAASQRKDEAHNSVLTTQSVINVMARQGGDIREAQNILYSARRAMQSGDYQGCLKLCEQSRDALKNPSKGGSASAAGSGDEAADRDELEKVAESILAVSKSESAPDTYSGTKLSMDQDGNYLSARFEMNTAKADIRKAVERGSDTTEADKLMAEAEAVFASGGYTKALSLAVRARKSVSVEAAGETIRLRKVKVAEEEMAEPTPEETSGRPARSCRECGAELEADDTFCGICGERVQMQKECSSCGTVARPTDTFCRKCGAKI